MNTPSSRFWLAPSQIFCLLLETREHFVKKKRDQSSRQRYNIDHDLLVRLEGVREGVKQAIGVEDWKTNAAFIRQAVMIYCDLQDSRIEEYKQRRRSVKARTEEASGLEKILAEKQALVAAQPTANGSHPAKVLTTSPEEMEASKLENWRTAMRVWRNDSTRAGRLAQKHGARATASADKPEMGSSDRGARARSGG